MEVIGVPAGSPLFRLESEVLMFVRAVEIVSVAFHGRIVTPIAGVETIANEMNTAIPITNNGRYFFISALCRSCTLGLKGRSR